MGLEPNGSVTYTGWLWRVDPVVHGANEDGYRGRHMGGALMRGSVTARDADTTAGVLPGKPLQRWRPG